MLQFLLSLTLAVGLMLGGAAQADADYPAKPVRVFVGFAPGGATDQLARLYAARLTEKLGQTFVVENRPGAGGNIAIQALTQTEPDGYTIAMGANYVAANAALKRNPYDWEKQVAPIAMIASTPNVLVVPANSPLSSVADVIAAAKKKGSNVTFGSAGVGSSIHLAGELFKTMAHVPMTHVPYKGVTPAEVDLTAGRVDLMFGSISSAIPLVKGGKLKLLAITGLQRIADYPDVPTIDESGLKGFDVSAVYILMGPMGIPQARIDRLAKAVHEINQEPAIQQQIARLYATTEEGGPKEARAFLEREVAKWEKVVETTGLKVD
ncbi:Bug family tripartite tricarboxylate transporter substrate binding protein [Bordetella genomosp. 13]|uniref:Bug family tripartite tricarboxylate transporter substrate binding protein n=1 Tax=Bordetella genomosp. 13 TaxID=463040 RepID=UPI0011AAF63A|nr:tripartite tricarboxylate transporter substrate binding protein [Bordetella genomosp. 13]